MRISDWSSDVCSSDLSRLRIGARTVLEDVTMGASISVNGVCLTVVGWDADEGWWEADAVDETFARTALGALRAGDRVNLERPVRLQDRLGGHLVQGHVRSEEHTSELQSLMRISYAVFCLKKT